MSNTTIKEIVYITSDNQLKRVVADINVQPAIAAAASSNIGTNKKGLENYNKYKSLADATPSSNYEGGARNSSASSLEEKIKKMRKSMKGGKRRLRKSKKVKKSKKSKK
jgi:hypothetical protein